MNAIGSHKSVTIFKITNYNLFYMTFCVHRNNESTLYSPISTSSGTIILSTQNTKLEISNSQSIIVRKELPTCSLFRPAIPSCHITT